MMHDWYFGGMHWIWWIIWVLLLVWIFFIPYPSSKRYSKKDRALEVLRERFARGEIDEQEFEQSKRVLFDEKK